jgi:hypothetical protein
MSWFPSGGINEHLISIYKRNNKERIKAFKRAKRLKHFAEEIALVDPNRLNPADFVFRSMWNKYYLLFSDESELIRKGIEATVSAWYEWKQDKTPFASENPLEDLL